NGHLEVISKLFRDLKFEITELKSQDSLQKVSELLIVAKNQFAKVNSIEEVLNQITDSIIETKNVSIKINNNQDSNALDVLNKLNNILENQIKDKKDYEELILEESLFQNSNLFYNIYILFAKDIFEPIQRNSFVNIFQMHE